MTELWIETPNDRDHREEMERRPMTARATIATWLMDNAGADAFTAGEEILKALATDGFEVIPAKLIDPHTSSVLCGWGLSSQRSGECERCGGKWSEHERPQDCRATKR